MTILTDDECREIYNTAMAMPERSVVQTMRVIEAAVIAKLSAGFEMPEPDLGAISISARKPPISMGYSVEAIRAAYAAGAATQLGADNAKLSGAAGRP